MAEEWAEERAEARGAEGKAVDSAAVATGEPAAGCSKFPAHD